MHPERWSRPLPARILRPVAPQDHRGHMRVVQRVIGQDIPGEMAVLLGIGHHDGRCLFLGVDVNLGVLKSQLLPEQNELIFVKGFLDRKSDRHFTPARDEVFRQAGPFFGGQDAAGQAIVKTRNAFDVYSNRIYVFGDGDRRENLIPAMADRSPDAGWPLGYTIGGLDNRVIAISMMREKPARQASACHKFLLPLFSSLWAKALGLRRYQAQPKSGKGSDLEGHTSRQAYPGQIHCRCLQFRNRQSSVSRYRARQGDFLACRRSA